MENKQIKLLEVVYEAEEKAYDSSGVDLTLICWMLSLTPGERLRYLQDNINAIQRLRNTKKL